MMSDSESEAQAVFDGKKTPETSSPDGLRKFKLDDVWLRVVVEIQVG